MPAVCDSDGVRFQYPETWELSRESSGPDVTFHLQSPGTAFWTLALLSERPAPDEALEAVIAAYREDYPELDLYDGPDWMLESPAAGCELDFVFMDLLNSAVVRAEATSVFTALVLYQAEAREFEEIRGEMEQITGSIKYAGDDLIDLPIVPLED